MLDLVIEGNVFLDGKLNKCCIGINEGKIVAIKKILKGDLQFDFGDKLILPAGIDIHVHFRDPGFTHKEDFRTGTESAAFGGICCVFDMPNTNPPAISKDSIQEKLETVSKKAIIDFGLYSSVIRTTRILSTAETCSAFKLYLASTTGDLLFNEKQNLSMILDQINSTNRVPAIHAESQKIIQQNLKSHSRARDLHDHLSNRPNDAEMEAISTLLQIARRWIKKNSEGLNEQNIKQIEKLKDSKFSRKSRPKKLEKTIDKLLDENFKRHIHICHISTTQGVDLLKKFRNDIKIVNRKNSVIITTEATPHHLLLNEKFNNGTFGKVNPPLRTVNDQNALWEAFKDGTINILASDHAPHTIDDKTQEFFSAPSGVPGVETMMPLFMSYVKHNRLNLETFVSAISGAPSELFQIPKGRIAEGYDGDLVVFDFYNENPIKSKNLHSKCGWTPYEKIKAIFPILTVVRGNIIIRDGNLEADPGKGKFYN